MRKVLECLTLAPLGALVTLTLLLTGCNGSEAPAGPGGQRHQPEPATISWDVDSNYDLDGKCVYEEGLYNDTLHGCTCGE